LGAIFLADALKMWGLESQSNVYCVDKSAAFAFEDLTDQEHGELLSKVKEVLKTELLKSGPHRRIDWEKGWGDNLKKFRKDASAESIIPGYFEKSEIMRWKQKWVRPSDSRLEQKLLGILVDSLIGRFASSNESIYEFGCGTGHHLFRLRKAFPIKKLIGLDWASSSQEVIKEYAMKNGDNYLFAENFDFFAPNYDLKVNKDSAFLTVASLEQVGTNFKSFVDFVLTSQPKVVINIEPMQEFLDRNHELDSLSILYCLKRNYLSGYFQYLLELEKQQKIHIHHSGRSYFGSLYIDGYSIVVWSPLEH
jgi:SAM-dependent methyltransferase